MQKLIMVIIFSILLGCGNSHKENSLEFKHMFCERKTNECKLPSIYKFKVRKYDNMVYINFYDEDGIPEGNQFLKNCKVFDKKNWNCEDLSMVDGELVDSLEKRMKHWEQGLYSKYIKVDK
jgi:hypothetical protein